MSDAVKSLITVVIVFGCIFLLLRCVALDVQNDRIDFRNRHKGCEISMVNKYNEPICYKCANQPESCDTYRMGR